MIIGGDFNCALSPMMDRLPPQTTQSKNAQAVLNINKEFDLLDIWRHNNPLLYPLRLEQVLTSIVNADQTGFIKGRSSYHNTRRLLNIIHYLNFTQTHGAIVSMDAEKAFNRIEWEYTVCMR